MSMQLPQIGQQNKDPYALPQQNDSGKTKLLVFGGIAVLLILLGVVLFSGGSSAGQTEMKDSVDDISQALAIIDEYEEQVQYAPTQNDIGLSQILLRGSQQRLSELFNTTYKPKKKLGGEGKLQAAAKTTLDTAQRNNTLDSDIITEVKKEVISAQRSLTRAKASFKKQDSRAIITTAQNDLTSIVELLNRAR